MGFCIRFHPVLSKGVRKSKEQINWPAKRQTDRYTDREAYRKTDIPAEGYPNTSI